jgi:hypothetical protein
MPAPLLGLPALLQTIATIGVGGAVGYKAQKDLQPYIKQLKSSPEDMDTPQLKMLRALLLPNQAIAAEVKDLISKSAPGLTGEGITIGPKAEDIEKVQEEIKQVTKPPITSTPIKPITTETFLAEPQQKPEPPVQPEVDIETEESFPDQSQELNIPIINYSKDVPKDFKELAKRSVGKDKGTEAVDALFDDEMLLDVLNKDQIQRIRQLEDQYVGDIMDRGDPSVPLAFTNSMVSQYEDYFEDYKQKLADVAEEKLGSEFPMFRLMRKDDALKMLKDQELPNIKVENETGEVVPFTMNVFGKDVPQLQENMSFSLNPRTALSFKEIFESDKPDEDYVLLEYKATPSDIVMRGHQAEADLVLNMSEAVNSPSSFKVYDFKYIKDGDLIKGLNVSANKEFDEFVNPKQKVEAPALVGTNAQEGGKIYKDITAGISAQKDVVPSLLEQGQLAKPIKDFFESNNQVINYKIGDTIGAYKGDVERSLDIEAFVKPDFKIDDFAEVIKERAKQFNQDAVFVAESVDKNYKNANVGFSLDFGSDLQMQDALSISRGIARLAEIDGFTFKTKNINYGDTSISLPQVEKDSALIEKTLKKYPLTEDIRKTGFIMPDGKMLNFNLRGGSVRDTEHRRVGYLVDDNYLGVHFGPMYDWMIRTGGVRVTGNQNRLVAELAGKPTTTQIRKIVDEYNNNRDKYDSLLIGVTIPGDSPQTSIAPRTAFGEVTGLGTPMANNLRKATFRLPMENFYEVNGEKANANDLYKRIQSTDIVGKTFTGIRQLNLPEFTNLNKDDALKRILNMENKIEEIAQNSGLKVLDKPKTKFYNTKVFTKGKDY